MVGLEEALEIAEKYVEEHYRDFYVVEIRNKVWGNMYNSNRYNEMNAFFAVCLRKGMDICSSYMLIIDKQDGHIIDFVDTRDEG